MNNQADITIHVENMLEKESWGSVQICSGMDDPNCHSERVMSAGNVMILWEIFATIFISDDVRRRIFQQL